MSSRSFTPAQVRQIATHLLGAPNTRLSRDDDLRFGSNGSVSVKPSTGEFYDHERGDGGGVIELIRREGEADPAAWLERNGFANGHTHLSGASKSPNGKATAAPFHIVETYSYRDEGGAELFQTCRLENGETAADGKKTKSFFQRRPDGNGGYVNGIAGVRQVPYRLPELTEAVAKQRWVFLCEGERKCDRLAALGFVATCNAMGAGKWPDALTPHFSGAYVIIPPDNDEPGRRHAQLVARRLKGVAARVLFLDLPGLPPKGDVVDWLDAGGTRDALVRLAKDAYEPDLDSARDAPEPSGNGEDRRDDAPEPNRATRRANGHRVKEQAPTSASALQAMVFPPIKYIVPRYIVEGCTLLAGAPKLGKSWLALEIGLAVASGGKCLGNIECEQGDVLYLALEDNMRRLQSRMRKLVMVGDHWPPGLQFVTECERANTGGIDQIRKWAASVIWPRLAIVDVLAMFKPIVKGRDALYDADYASLKGLQELASELGIGVLVLHHTRKSPAEIDPFEKVSGTLGLSGAADSTLILSRDGNGCTIYGRGRDIPEIETAVSFDREICRWRVLGEAAEVRRSDERSAVVTALKEFGEQMSPADIAAVTNTRGGNIRRLLSKMVKDGQIVKAKRGKYSLPGGGEEGTNHNVTDVTDVTDSLDTVSYCPLVHEP